MIRLTIRYSRARVSPDKFRSHFARKQEKLFDESNLTGLDETFPDIASSPSVVMPLKSNEIQKHHLVSYLIKTRASSEQINTLVTTASQEQRKSSHFIS
jgi:hypothetical protein